MPHHARSSSNSVSTSKKKEEAYRPKYPVGEIPVSGIVSISSEAAHEVRETKLDLEQQDEVLDWHMTTVKNFMEVNNLDHDGRSAKVMESILSFEMWTKAHFLMTLVTPSKWLNRDT
jgi:hypothetical protein